MSLTIFDNRQVMIKFYSTLIGNPKVLEVGVFKGEFLDYIYNYCAPSHIDGVDLFEGNMGSGDVDGNNFTFCLLNNVYYELIQKYSNNQNVKLHKSYSDIFLSKCNDNEYDIIYIDADHTYEGVKRDLTHSFKKIKNGGYIMGHDYEMNMNKARKYYDFGVKKAVDEFCLNYNQKIIAKAIDGCVSFCIQINK
jgi:hypothetical protein